MHEDEPAGYKSIPATERPFRVQTRPWAARPQPPKRHVPDRRSGVTPAAEAARPQPPKRRNPDCRSGVTRPREDNHPRAFYMHELYPADSGRSRFTIEANFASKPARGRNAAKSTNQHAQRASKSNARKRGAVSRFTRYRLGRKQKAVINHGEIVPAPPFPDGKGGLGEMGETPLALEGKGVGGSGVSASPPQAGVLKGRRVRPARG